MIACHMKKYSLRFVQRNSCHHTRANFSSFLDGTFVGYEPPIGFYLTETASLFKNVLLLAGMLFKLMLEILEMLTEISGYETTSSKSHFLATRSIL